MGGGDVIVLEPALKIVVHGVLRVGENEIDTGMDLHGNVTSLFTNLRYSFNIKEIISEKIRACQGIPGKRKMMEKVLRKLRKRP